MRLLEGLLPRLIGSNAMRCCRGARWHGGVVGGGEGRLQRKIWTQMRLGERESARQPRGSGVGGQQWQLAWCGRWWWWW